MTHGENAFRVLLAEDDDDHAELATYHLSECAADVMVTRVEDGQQAVDYLLGERANGDPHLILLDVKLPRLDGLGVLKTIRARPELNCVPVVMLSTSNADGDKREAYRYFANSYVLKPSDVDGYPRLMRQIVAYWRDYNKLPSSSRAG